MIAAPPAHPAFAIVMNTMGPGTKATGEGTQAALGSFVGMKSSLRLPLALAAFAAVFAGQASAGVEGLWRTPTDNGEVRITDCGAKICARLVTSDRLKAFPDQRDVHNHEAASRSRPLKNALIAQGFSGGPTEYTGGKLYDPAGGGTYSGRIVLTGPNTLKLTGCIVAPFCRSQTWTRIGPS
jgi:uncharacterized protein (DUF2147 family)